MKKQTRNARADNASSTRHSINKHDTHLRQALQLPLRTLTNNNITPASATPIFPSFNSQLTVINNKSHTTPKKCAKCVLRSSWKFRQTWLGMNDYYQGSGSPVPHKYRDEVLVVVAPHPMNGSWERYMFGQKPHANEFRRRGEIT